MVKQRRLPPTRSANEAVPAVAKMPWLALRANVRALVAGVIIMGGIGCSGTGPPPEQPVRPVKTTVVAVGDAQHTRAFPGKVEAARKAELAFQVSGLLVKLPVKEGQRVAKGEVIAELRLDEFQARLKGLQAQLDQSRAALRGLQSGERPEQQRRLEAERRAARAKLENAQIEFDRNTRLQERGAGAMRDVDRARANYKVAQEDYQAAQEALQKGTIGRAEDIEAREAEVRGLEARVVEANIQLRDATLRAPYDGVIAQRFVEANQNIKAKEPVVRFQDVDEIDVAVDVPEAVMAADLRAADVVQIVAEFSGAPGIQFPVRIREIAQVADPTTQTFQVRAALKAPPAGVKLLPGMTARVTLTYRRANILGSRMLVPVSAVFKDSTGEQVVWVLGSDQTVARHPVKLGEATGSQIEIVAGLQPGDRIAVAGAPLLREGMKVRDLGDALGGGS
jgi:membrane fusion protein, multidrug efflux system